MPTSEQTHDLFAVRLEKLKALQAQGKDPFQANCDQTHTAEEAKALLMKDPETETGVQLAGRILAFRLMGKASFVKIQDRSGILQVYVTRDGLGEEAYAAFKKLDLGDIVGFTGTLFRTKTEEITLRASHCTLVSKALRPIPSEFYGLNDDEKVYRQRYLDLIINPVSRDLFFKRSQIIEQMRRFFWERSFTEIEGPMLQNIPGGAAARPFVTHMNALNHDFYMRISLELYLKRMLIGGFDRVFEIGRNFRNEGLSRKHNPEFTMLEAYQAYTDYRGMMILVYDLVQHLCKHVLGGNTQVKRPDGQVIELGGAWREVAYRELVCEATGEPAWFELSKEDKLKRCGQMKIQVDPSLEDYEVTQNVFEKKVEPTLIDPIFVTHIPKELCPLAKLNPENPQVLDVFELCINGQEIAPAYSEQNSPIVQREMFEAQVGEEVQNMDHDFLRAMEYGMPPAGGIGLGIDRLCMLLLGAASIRDVILFPSMKSEGGAADE